MAGLRETCSCTGFTKRFKIRTDRSSRSLNNGEEITIIVKAEGSLSLRQNGMIERAVSGKLYLVDDAGLAALKVLSARRTEKNWLREKMEEKKKNKIGGNLPYEETAKKELIECLLKKLNDNEHVISAELN